MVNVLVAGCEEMRAAVAKIVEMVSKGMTETFGDMGVMMGFHVILSFQSKKGFLLMLSNL